MNRVLKRQIKNSFGKDFDITTLDPKIQEFIQNVEESYDEFEKEKKFLENVVDVNSTELYEANKQIIQQNKNLNELLEKNEKLLENRIEENLEIETTLKQYKQAMDTALLVSTFDYEGKITFVNSNFCALTGYSKTEVLDKKYNFLHYEESSHLDEEIFEAIRNKKIWTGVLKYKNRDLKIYDLNTTIFPILNAQNEILEYMSIFQDITEIENSRQKALDLDRAKSLFIANMSHELRTPLNGILGFSQLLRRQKDISEKIKTYVDKINSSGEHLLKLINSILDFSKIESGEIVLEHLEINLYNLIAAALVQQENTAKLKNISLHIDYDSSLGKEFLEIPCVSLKY
jgi:PAS domain S-box-containing protein